MIYSVNGTVDLIEPNLAVIDCGGVGYACRTTANTLSQLKIGEKAKLLTYLSVREDAVELFGFYDAAELNCFKMLISVSGVGPKAALSILSGMTPQAFALCVASGDGKTLTNAPGIGRKTAERIVLELKDKVSKQDVAAGVKGSAVPIVAARQIPMPRQYRHLWYSAIQTARQPPHSADLTRQHPQTSL